MGRAYLDGQAEDLVGVEVRLDPLEMLQREVGKELLLRYAPEILETAQLAVHVGEEWSAGAVAHPHEGDVGEVSMVIEVVPVGSDSFEEEVEFVVLGVPLLRVYPALASQVVQPVLGWLCMPRHGGKSRWGG